MDGLDARVERIRELESALNGNELDARFNIALEVKAIHEEGGATGIKAAVKRLKRWNQKTLYEYEAVAKAWDPATFRRVSAQTGPEGNVLTWSDFVGLTYVSDARDRERVRQQALAENKSVRAVKRAPVPQKKRASSTSALDSEGEGDVSLVSTLCALLNDAPVLAKGIETAMLLLEHPVPEAITELRQVMAATADRLDELKDSINAVVPLFRRLDGPSIH